MIRALPLAPISLRNFTAFLVLISSKLIASTAMNSLSATLAENADLIARPVSYTHLDVYKRQG